MDRKRQLQRIYQKYNRRQYVDPDPLLFLYDYPDIHDREIVGLIASSLAYGRVAQILKSVRHILDAVTPHPRKFFEKSTPSAIKKVFRGFKHRFTTDDEMASLLIGVRSVLREHGSLNAYFLRGFSRNDENVLGALGPFVKGLRCDSEHLLPCPERGSACKRLNLYLRWMVRKDAVDPGGWQGIPKSRLIVPLDVHMARIGTAIGLTKRKSPDIKMALEITEAFRRISPKDPVKYDFALTRFGIRDNMNAGDVLK